MQIEGCSATGNGGAVSVNTSTFTMTGGTLRGGQAPMAPDVILQSRGVAQVSGDAVARIYVTTAGSLTLGTFNPGATVTLEAGGSLTLAQNVTADPRAFVTCTASFKLVWENSELKLTKN